MASWGYIMTLMPFLQDLAKLLVAEEAEHPEDKSSFVQFYVDDGNLCAPHRTMLKVLEFVITEGPRYGHYLKRSKGTYLLGRCGSAEEAADRKRALIERFQFVESIIRVHPDNALNISTADAELLYGMEILGSPVGTEAFTRAWLLVRLEELRQTAAKLTAYPDYQCRSLLFRSCFCPKITHLMRCLRPALVEEFVGAFESLKKDIFCSFADFPNSALLDEDAWTRARLPISDGGGGFGANLSDICHSAFAASFLAFANSNIGEKFNIKNVVLDVERGANVEISLVRSFVECYRSLNAVDRDSFSDIDTFLNLRGTNERTLQGIFSDAVVKSKVKLFKEHILSKDRHEYAWFVSAACPESGRWLTVVPKITRGKQFRFSTLLWTG